MYVNIFIHMCILYLKYTWNYFIPIRFNSNPMSQDTFSFPPFCIYNLLLQQRSLSSITLNIFTHSLMPRIHRIYFQNC